MTHRLCTVETIKLCHMLLLYAYTYTTHLPTFRWQIYHEHSPHWEISHNMRTRVQAFGCLCVCVCTSVWLRYRLNEILRDALWNLNNSWATYPGLDANQIVIWFACFFFEMTRHWFILYLYVYNSIRSMIRNRFGVFYSNDINAALKHLAVVRWVHVNVNCSILSTSIRI